MKNGFFLRKLQLSGNNVSIAEIDLSPGFNVITGPSDTGKSYIFQCFDYILGGSSVPKSIKESEGYSLIRLEISQNNTFYTIQRDLKGGDILLFESDISNIEKSHVKEILAEKHNEKNKKNISSFLLGLSGIDENIKIRKNARLETENLTFRTISHFFLIDEESIIQEKSPVFGKTSFKETAQKWAFHYLLTGENGNQLQSIPNPEILKEKKNAQKFILNQIIQDLEIDTLKLSNQAKEMMLEFDNLESMITEQVKNVNFSSKQIELFQQKRRNLWNEQQETDSRIITINELLLRFSLLKDHYKTDIKRLEFMSEGNYYFMQLDTVYCPLCGSHLNDHDSKQRCIENENELIDIQTSMEKENKKINIQILDLENTFNILENECKSLQEKSSYLKNLIGEIDGQINQSLTPKLITDKSKLDDLLIKRKITDEIEINKNKIQKFTNQLNIINISVAKNNKVFVDNNLNTIALRNLSAIIEQLLINWKYSNPSIVEFSEKNLDILINGTSRISHGKGVRALLRSAFNIGLLRYCIMYNHPHPRFVILDSPLLNFKERSSQDIREEISGEIKKAFFSDLSNVTNEEQIIILENEPVPENLRNKINIIEFVGPSRDGRVGFFPVKNYPKIS